MDRAIMIGLRWFVVAATVTGAVAEFLNWLVIAAASITLISICLEAASVSRRLTVRRPGPAGAQNLR